MERLMAMLLSLHIAAGTIALVVAPAARVRVATIYLLSSPS